MARWPIALLALLTTLTHSPRVETAGPPGQLWPIDAAARQSLDRDAKSQRRLDIIEQKTELAGNITAFLLTALDLPAAEELRRSRDVHADVLKRERVQLTPAAAERVLARLLKQVPAFQLPPGFNYSLTVLDRDSATISTPGGGFLHLTRGLVDRILADRERGESALAFLVARQIGHSALGHCRRGWQRVYLEEDLLKGIELTVEPGVWRNLLETKVVVTGKYVEFLYSPRQETRADLYALYLCRNAGIDLDQALDGMRYLAARSTGPAGLRRLKRLLQERDGEADPDSSFGLFAYDRTTGELVRCRPAAVARGERPVIFVHGLYGSNESWLAYLRNYSAQKALDGRPLLVFRYPGNGSLARAGLMLTRAVKEAVVAPDQATFVCHSAGGLAFRWYAEKRGGAFDRAVLLATPNQGSNLTQLKFLVDLQEFFGSLRLGIADGLDRILAEGGGEIGLDLHPDSLFLRALGHNRKLAARYHVFYGEWIRPIRAQLLKAGFTIIRQTIEPRLVPALPDGILRRQAERLITTLTLPPEIVQGDCVVGKSSACLDGAGKTTRLPLRHMEFRGDSEAMRLVLKAITVR